MNPQPDESSHHNYENDIEERVSLHPNNQADRSILVSSIRDNSNVPPVDQAILYNEEETRFENWNEDIRSPSQWPAGFDENTYYGIESHESLPTNTGPANQIPIPQTQIARTTISSSIVDGTSTTDFDPVPIPIPSALKKTDVRSLSRSEQEKLIFVSAQLPLNSRRRYATEGKRRTKKLGEKPLTIDLSNLKPYQKPERGWWLRLSLVTCNDNPNDIIMHPDKLEYFSEVPDTLKYFSKVRKLPDGSIGIDITKEIEKGEIQLKDLAIVKILDKNFTFNLIPYNLKKIPDRNNCKKHPFNPEKTHAGNAKYFREIYNTASSQIACQIIIHENGQSRFTYITCKTGIMTENKRKPVKRLAKNKKRPGKKPRKTLKA